MTTQTQNTTTTAKTGVPCGDGCGELTNPGRRFRAGHDAKLAGMLLTFANGQGGDLPRMLQDQLASGALKLPAPTMRTALVTVSLSIGVSPEATDAEVGAEVRRILKRRAVTVTKVAVKAQA